MNKSKTRGQLISKLQYMKSQPNGNAIQHICYKDIDNICNYLLEDKNEIERLKEENNRLSQQLVECQRVLKQNQEIIDDIKVDSIEQFEKQSKRIQELELKEKQWIETERDYRDELKELKRNKPLKFEELKPNMWVFDNKYKEYCYIYFIAGKYPHRKYIDNCESDSEFEENRFFRYEVKE